MARMNREGAGEGAGTAYEWSGVEGEGDECSYVQAESHRVTKGDYTLGNEWQYKYGKYKWSADGKKDEEEKEALQKSLALQFRISEKKILAQVGRQGKVPFKLLCANLDDNGMDMNRKANMTPGDWFGRKDWCRG